MIVIRTLHVFCTHALSFPVEYVRRTSAVYDDGTLTTTMVARSVLTTIIPAHRFLIRAWGCGANISCVRANCSRRLQESVNLEGTVLKCDNCRERSSLESPVSQSHLTRPNTRKLLERSACRLPLRSPPSNLCDLRPTQRYCSILTRRILHVECRPKLM